MSKTTNEMKTFALVHGAWHGAWCWDHVRPYLEKAGHGTVAVELPTTDSTLNYDDYADLVSKELDNYQNIYLVGHSRAGNIIPRVAGKMSIQHLVYLCSPVPMFSGTDTHVIQDTPVRNTTLFQQGIIPLENGLTSFDRDAVQEVFYNKCTTEMVEWASGKLRDQCRQPIYNLPVPKPDTAQSYIYTRDDHVIFKEYSKYVAEKLLGVEAIELPGDHSPFLSYPAELANALLRL